MQNNNNEFVKDSPWQVSFGIMVVFMLVVSANILGNVITPMIARNHPAVEVPGSDGGLLEEKFSELASTVFEMEMQIENLSADQDVQAIIGAALSELMVELQKDIEKLKKGEFENKDITNSQPRKSL